MALHIIDEAKRCLNCKNPMCVKGCPIHTPIPKMIQTLLEHDINEAGELLFDNNPLSLVCSLVCNHENQCEGHCILGRKGKPVHISSIEHYVSDTYFDKMKVSLKSKNGMKAAVIGSGPAGITISVILAKKGYDVTIFESKDKIGGVLQYGIPDFRLPKSILERYKKKLIEIGIKIRPNTTIGGALEIEDLFRDGYGSIFIGTGVWRPKTLGVKGESLGNVHFAIDYLAKPSAYDLGESIAIIGAGNAAMDVARTILRKGASKVTLYEMGQHAMASERELSYAKVDGAEFEFCKKIIEINEDGPVFKDIFYDADGNITGYSTRVEQVHADSTIISISQRPKNKIVLTTKGLEARENGFLVTDDHGTTTREGIFASGDVVIGAKTVVEAVAHSKSVADGMDQYMRNKDRRKDDSQESQ
ncbi:MAG TPA: NAD(P)-dependent oxidoreductase [Candidatus Merdenecus merdavium]|nr:NAD(P)-dependent oxidoreductase [Candidatus Merdenecus merdavium]